MKIEILTRCFDIRYGAPPGHPPEINRPNVPGGSLAHSIEIRLPWRLFTVQCASDPPIDVTMRGFQATVNNQAGKIVDTLTRQ